MNKILILANNSVGLYNFRFELIEELIKQNYEVYFSLPESAEDEKVRLLIDAGAIHMQTDIDRRGINPFKDLKLIKQYRKVINNVRPDIILTYTIKPNIYGAYVAEKFNKTVIMNITGIGTSLNDSKLKYLIINLYKYACRKSEIVFFQNESNLSFFINNNIVDINKTITVPGSGVNTNRFIPDKKKREDKLIRFLFIGRLMKEKGIEEYLYVADKITKEYANVEFQILGPFEENQYKAIIGNNMNLNIKYLGISADVRNEIKEVDCIVNPSYHEGMSNVLLEGASMGKPLIASNIPGCMEIIEDGHNGYLFNVKSSESLQEKLVKFIDLDINEKDIMGQNSRMKIIKEFDRKIVINEYVKSIKNIIRKGDVNEII